MWGALTYGDTTLSRSPDCTYDPLYSLPRSKSSNGFKNMWQQLGVGVDGYKERGICNEGGYCVCNTPYFGRSDFVNLDTLDCQYNVNDLRCWASFGLLGSVVVFVNCWRILRKTYNLRWGGAKAVSVPSSLMLFLLCHNKSNPPYSSLRSSPKPFRDSLSLISARSRKGP